MYGKNPRTRPVGSLIAGLVLALVSFPTAAQAQDSDIDGGLDINGFDPVAQTSRYTVVRDAELGDQGDVDLTLSSNYGLNPLETGDKYDGVEDPDLVDHFFGMDVGIAAAATDWLEIGLNMPVLQLQQGIGGREAIGSTGGTVGIGDLSVNVAFAPVQQKRGMPLDLAIVPRAIFPTGTEGQFVSADAFRAGGDVVLGRSWDFFRFAVTGGYMWVSDSERVGPYYLDDYATYGAAIGVPFMDDQLEVDLEYRGSHVVTQDARDALGGDAGFDTYLHTPMELLAGLSFRPNAIPLDIKAGVGPGLTNGYGTPDVRAFLQFGLDWDNLGPEPEAVIVTRTDNDWDDDGILNDNDACPRQAEDIDGWEDLDGCPDPDNDSDGILDVRDGHRLADGSIARHEVYPAYGDCMYDPETFNDFRDGDGCPDAQREVLVTRRVFFGFDESSLVPEAQAALSDLADTLKDHPEIDLIEIVGHADERGPADYNVDLSRARAQAVHDFLEAQGVATERVQIVAQGESAPALPNADTEVEYSVNRRARLRIEDDSAVVQVFQRDMMRPVIPDAPITAPMTDDDAVADEFDIDDVDETDVDYD